MLNLSWLDEMADVQLWLRYHNLKPIIWLLKGHYCIKCYTLSTALIPTICKFSPITGCSLALKGLRHEIYNFFEGPKNPYLLYMRRLFLNFFAALLCSHSKIKSYLASFKTLTNCENNSSNPLQTACWGIQEPANDSVICP